MTILGIYIDPNLFNGLITLFVGLFAFFIYYKQKSDYKKDAANVILLEIENAENLLKKASESLKIGIENSVHILPENNFVMQTESWSKYRYLFVRDLTPKEWDEISDFYIKCKLFDQAVAYNDSFFQKDVEQIRENAHRIIADFTDNYAKDMQKVDDKVKDKAKVVNITKALNEYRSEFEKTYLQPTNLFLYSPVKSVNDAIYCINNMNMHLSLSTVGIKLKKIAGMNDFFYKIFRQV